MNDNEPECVIKFSDSYNKKIIIQKQNNKNKTVSISQFLKQVPYFLDEAPTLN